MALSIEKRLSALESRTAIHNAIVRFVFGEKPTAEEAAEHAEIEASGELLMVVQLVPSPHDLALDAAAAATAAMVAKC